MFSGGGKLFLPFVADAERPQPQGRGRNERPPGSESGRSAAVQVFSPSSSREAKGLVRALRRVPQSCGREQLGVFHVHQLRSFPTPSLFARPAPSRCRLLPGLALHSFQEARLREAFARAPELPGGGTARAGILPRPLSIVIEASTLFRDAVRITRCLVLSYPLSRHRFRGTDLSLWRVAPRLRPSGRCGSSGGHGAGHRGTALSPEGFPAWGNTHRERVVSGGQRPGSCPAIRAPIPSGWRHRAPTPPVA